MKINLPFHKLMYLTCVAALLYGCQAASNATPLPLPAAGQTETLVKLETDTPALAVNQTVEVAAWIENVQALYGVELQIAFDAQRLTLLDADDTQDGAQVRPGDFLSPDFVVRNAGRAGEIIFVATQLPPQAPVSGDGALVMMQFQAIHPGPAAVKIQQALLASPQGEPITTQTRNLTITVQE